MQPKEEKQNLQRISTEYLSKFLHKEASSEQARHPRGEKGRKASNIALQPESERTCSDVHQQSPQKSSRTTAASVYLASFRSRPSPSMNAFTTTRDPVNIEEATVRGHGQRGVSADTQEDHSGSHHPAEALRRSRKAEPAPKPQERRMARPPSKKPRTMSPLVEGGKEPDRYAT